MQKFHFFLSFFLFVIFITSFLLEKFLHFEPCILCKVERWTYFVLSIFFFFSIVLNKSRTINFLKIVLPFGGFLLAVYHKFVQFGVASCSFNNKFFNHSQTFENFQESLQNSLPCVIKSSIFGIEFVWFNITIFFIIFFIICVMQIYGQKFSLTNKKHRSI